MPERASPTPQLRIGPKIPISKIDAVVAANLGAARVRGNARPHVLYRQIAMYLCKHVGGWSTTQIGKFYNCRDHSTVSYATRRIESLRASDAELDALVCSLMEQCKITENMLPPMDLDACHARF
jgi:chromosomal replication initiator protein